MASSRRKSINDSKQVAFSRFLLVIAIFGVWILAIGVRLAYLQVTKHEELFKKALAQRQDNVRSRALRGTIFDRDRRVLAISINARSLAADPSKLSDIESVSKKLAPLIGTKAKDLQEQLREGQASGKQFMMLARKLDDETVVKVNKALGGEEARDANIPVKGLFWREEQKRSYPQLTRAAHIVGYANSDDEGQTGIEKSQEAHLRGSVIKGRQIRDRLGRVYESEQEHRDPPKDVVLTISSNIQDKTEEALARGVKAAGAKSAMAVVMVPQTGEILALANYPTFDPNSYAEAKPELWMNKAVQSVYAPGSVFKLITYGSSLEEGLIDPEGKIDCSRGSIEVAGHVFKDSHRIGNVTYREALAHSSNVAAIRTGLGLGKERFYNYARSFGFGEPTGIELPGELRGQFRAPEKWHGSSLGSLSIGYEIGVTAVQMTTAFATVANGGIRPQPFIVREVAEEDGTPVSKTESKGVKVLSPETAASLRKMLREVVVKGTGKQAQLNGYTSAGKTGTAWKYNPQLKKVDSGKYIASFIGFAPAENPAVVISVVMDEPTAGGRAGGTVAAPVFRDIAEQILPELNIVPDATIKKGPETSVTLPEVVEDENARGFDEDEDLSRSAAPESKPSASPAAKPDPRTAEPESPSKKPARGSGDRPAPAKTNKPEAVVPKTGSDRQKKDNKDKGKEKRKT